MKNLEKNVIYLNQEGFLQKTFGVKRINQEIDFGHQRGNISRTFQYLIKKGQKPFEMKISNLFS